MIISTGTLSSEALMDKVVLVTGAGGGIGYEAARALLWLGARVIIAEIQQEAGEQAIERLHAEFGAGRAIFIHTDVGDEQSVNRLREDALQRFGPVDIVINNATLAPLGAVVDTPIADWDASYRVNLRGPALLARAFVPSMIARGSGAFICVSSVGQAYMAAYEAVKAAQVHLASTLDAELEGSGVVAFTIGPGFVPTQTADSAIPKLASLMGKAEDELREILKEYTLSVEAAGAGFAAAAAMAERYRGQEISSNQALLDAGISLAQAKTALPSGMVSTAEPAKVAELAQRIRTTLAEQAAGWKQRSIFERQWMLRTFRNKAGMPVEEWLALLEKLERGAITSEGASLEGTRAPLDRLAVFYAHLAELAKGYGKDPSQREAQVAIVRGWQEDVLELVRLFTAGGEAG